MTDTRICCFTGHRLINDRQKQKLFEILDVLLDNLITDGYTVFKAGGALGFDMLAEESVLRKKENGRNIRLELLLPCREQAEKWRPEEKRRYEWILADADQIEYVSEHYTAGCMHSRNRRLIEDSNLCVTFCNRVSGGTASTCRLAREKGLEIINLADCLPDTPEESADT